MTLPQGWAKARITDVATVRAEKTDPKELGTAPFIGLEHIEPRTGRLVSQGTAADVRSSVAQFKTGDILFGRLRPYLNKVIEASFDGCASAEIVPFTPAEGIVPSLLKRLMMSAEFLDFTASLDRGDRPRVKAEEVESYPLLIPPTAEQRRIVTKLDALAARLARARAELDRVPVLVDKLRKGVLIGSFGEQIDAAWPTLQSIGLSIEAGKNLKCEERPPYDHELGVVKVSAVSSERFEPSESKTLPPTYQPAERDRIRDGDLLLARASGSLRLVGRVAIANTATTNLYLSDKVLRLCLPDALVSWVYWFLRSPVGRSQIESAASGISMHNITQPSLKGLKIPMLDSSRRATHLVAIEAAYAHADALEVEAVRARALIDRLESAILAKAFRGELVPQDPHDEPASVLLDRIRARRAAASKPKRGRRVAGAPTA